MRLAVKTVAAFLICWVPISILTIAKTTATEKINPKLESTVFTFAFTNSLINPFIYFAHMRKAIATALGCIKAANLKRISLRGDVTHDETVGPGEKVKERSSSVQPKIVDVSTSPCLIEKRLTGNHEIVVCVNKETTKRKQRVNSLIV